MAGGPLVTVVVPVRDEEARIEGCLAALNRQDLHPGKVEVLVIDGGSSDATVAVTARLLADQGWWCAQVLHSPAGDRSSNLNVGLAHASAPVVVRVDARSRIPSGYLRRCVELLESRTDVAVVGGRQRAVTDGTRPIAVGVARALNNRWGMGLARYRRSGASGEADTVYLGAYRTDQVRRAGAWRTDLAVNEDFDLNRRLAQFGMVWFDSHLTVDYVPRSALTALVRQYWAFGTGKARYWRMSGDRPQPRQVALLAGPPVGLGLFAAVLVVGGPVAAGSLLAAAAGAAAIVEVVASDGPHGGLWAHVCAVAALGCVAAAWLGGVTFGTLRPGRKNPVGCRPVRRTA